MSEKMVTGHTLKSFDEEMLELNRLVNEAAIKARDQLAEALHALDEEAIDLARQVIMRDKEIDSMELDADNAVFHIIARHQPVAKDLRQLLAVSKMMTDLEHIGDEARELARLTLTFYDDDASSPNYRLLSDIHKLGRFVDDMLAKAMCAYAEDEVDLALQVLRLNEDLREEMIAALRRLSTYLLEDARSVGHVVHINLGLRGVEKIGSHAAYIARHVIFLITGLDVRHESLEEVKRNLEART